MMTDVSQPVTSVTTTLSHPSLMLSSHLQNHVREAGPVLQNIRVSSAHMLDKTTLDPKFLSSCPNANPLPLKATDFAFPF